MRFHIYRENEASIVNMTNCCAIVRTDTKIDPNRTCRQIHLGLGRWARAAAEAVSRTAQGKNKPRCCGSLSDHFSLSCYLNDFKYASLANFVTDRMIIMSKIASTPVFTCTLAKIQTLFTEF